MWRVPAVHLPLGPRAPPEGALLPTRSPTPMVLKPQCLAARGANLHTRIETERVLLGDVFHAKIDAKTLCFTVISCKNISKIGVLSYFLINFVRSKPIPV